ncbi:MAG: protein-glutamate O-methyltransferase CheR, partial [Armatimonadota bacterium]|nr:protein-glutamate O-methyltransferase CheR [Armatimonadota bacterium]
MDPVLLQRFESLTAARTGLHIREKDRSVFQGVLLSQMQRLKLPTPEDYYRLLEADHDPGDREWRQLVTRLTNRESYFFRDKGQIALLRERILPELIARNKQRRSLRLWSAGCSTGEEPYTLAMLLDQLLPRRDGWNILILGTDINEDSLDVARHAVYHKWSFRMVDPRLQARYFHSHGDTWKLDSRIRHAVTFRYLNLFGDKFPNASQEVHDMDLIVCRNVFIYFEHDAVATVLPKLANTLRDGGYLMTGHAELNNQKLGYLHPRMFAESAIYQRVTDERLG